MQTIAGVHLRGTQKLLSASVRTSHNSYQRRQAEEELCVDINYALLFSASFTVHFTGTVVICLVQPLYMSGERRNVITAGERKTPYLFFSRLSCNT